MFARFALCLKIAFFSGAGLLAVHAAMSGVISCYSPEVAIAVLSILVLVFDMGQFSVRATRYLYKQLWNVGIGVALWGILFCDLLPEDLTIGKYFLKYKERAVLMIYPVLLAITHSASHFESRSSRDLVISVVLEMAYVGIARLAGIKIDPINVVVIIAGTIFAHFLGLFFNARDVNANVPDVRPVIKLFI